jgi:hypothetical protein
VQDHAQQACTQQQQQQQKQEEEDDDMACTEGSMAPGTGTAGSSRTSAILRAIKTEAATCAAQQETPSQTRKRQQQQQQQERLEFDTAHLTTAEVRLLHEAVEQATVALAVQQAAATLAEARSAEEATTGSAAGSAVDGFSAQGVQTRLQQWQHQQQQRQLQQEQRLATPAGPVEEDVEAQAEPRAKKARTGEVRVVGAGGGGYLVVVKYE